MPIEGFGDRYYRYDVNSNVNNQNKNQEDFFTDILGKITEVVSDWLKPIEVFFEKRKIQGEIDKLNSSIEFRTRIIWKLESELENPSTGNSNLNVGTNYQIISQYDLDQHEESYKTPKEIQEEITLRQTWQEEDRNKIKELKGRLRVLNTPSRPSKTLKT